MSTNRSIRRFVAVMAVAGGAIVPFADSASAQSNAQTCPGGLISTVASSWPFAHDDEGGETFAPPTGGFAKWVPIFTPFENPGEFVQYAKRVDCTPVTS